MLLNQAKIVQKLENFPKTQGKISKNLEFPENRPKKPVIVVITLYFLEHPKLYQKQLSKVTLHFIRDYILVKKCAFSLLLVPVSFWKTEVSL